MSKVHVVCVSCGAELGCYTTPTVLIDQTFDVICGRCQCRSKDDVRPTEATPEAIAGVVRTLSAHMDVIAKNKAFANEVLAKLERGIQTTDTILLLKGYIGALTLLEELARVVE